MVDFFIAIYCEGMVGVVCVYETDFEKPAINEEIKLNLDVFNIVGAL